MRMRWLGWVLVAALVALGVSGCITVREPEPRYKGYPNEPEPAPAAPKQETKEAPPVTWGPLPAPVYPKATATGQSERITPGDKPIAYRNFNYTTPDSASRVEAFYRERMGQDIEVRNIGRQVAIFKNLEKGNVTVSIYQASGRTEITIQESQQLQPKRRGLFGRG
jgi:hypothetical protein